MQVGAYIKQFDTNKKSSYIPNNKHLKNKAKIYKLIKMRYRFFVAAQSKL